MRKILFFVALLCAAVSVIRAQDMERVLADIERNNPSLRAQQRLADVQRAEIRNINTLENPEAELIHSWQRNSPEKVVEINVTQGFDFPSAYAARRRAARIKEQQWGHELNAARQSLLLEGKKLCIELIALRQEYRLLTERVTHAQKLVDGQTQALEKGEATILDKNRADMEWVEVQGMLDLKAIEMQAVEEQLANLNGGIPVELTDTVFPMRETVLPFDVMLREYSERAPELSALLAGQKSAEAELRVSRSESLPGLKVGYHFEKSGGDKLNGLIAGISVPLWSGRRQVKQSKAQIEYARSLVESERADMESSLKELYARYDILQQTLERLSPIVGQQTVLRQYITDAYRIGELGGHEYLSELNTLYSVKEQYIATERELQLTIAEINALNL